MIELPAFNMSAYLYNILKATVEISPLLKQDCIVDYEHLDDCFEQLRSDYWSVRCSPDEANKKIELLESLCHIHGISIPEEIPF